LLNIPGDKPIRLSPNLNLLQSAQADSEPSFEPSPPWLRTQAENARRNENGGIPEEGMPPSFYLKNRFLYAE
jgi:hypothetical protein